MSHDHSEMMARSEAIELVCDLRETSLDTRQTELVPLDEIAGRTVAEPIIAEQDVPTDDYATMDGYAFDATDDYPYTIVHAEVYPEDEPPPIDEGEAVEIATGAPLPSRANAVLKREQADVDDDELRGPPIEPGVYTYEQGSNVRSDERLFEAGERLSPKDAILLGDLGRETVEVVEPLSVGVLATGTEIHEQRSADLDSPMLMGLLRSWGHKATYEGTVPDDNSMVKSAIADLANRYDVVVTTGGSSVGHKDYVIRSLAELGEIEFHRVSVRPGKPIAVATLPDAVAFAIPGKPLGAHTIASLVMRPFFTGPTVLPSIEASFSCDLQIGPEGFEYVVPVTLEDGRAIPLGHTDSVVQIYDTEFDPSVLSASTRATRADGFVITENAIAANEQVDVVPYETVE